MVERLVKDARTAVVRAEKKIHQRIAERENKARQKPKLENQMSNILASPQLMENVPRVCISPWQSRAARVCLCLWYGVRADVMLKLCDRMSGWWWWTRW